MPRAPQNYREFESLVQIVKDLRGPDGCPWDKEQDHSTLTRYALEEAFELAEAIDIGDMTEITEELGDLLLQVVLHAEIARQDERFDIHDVIEAIGRKMVRRHPHVFADVEVSGSSEVLDNWSKIKAAEKKKKGTNQTHDSPFGVPLNMPALLRSQKIGEKTRKHRFDWSQPSQVLAKVEEEIDELKQALDQGGRRSELQHEVGDILFSVAQLARHLDLDAEQCLRQTNRRFESRFARMQKLAQQKGQDFSKLPEEQLEKLWQESKELEAEEA